MPDIALEPILLSDVLLTLGANDYQGSVSKVELAPSSSIVNWKGMTPSASYSFPTSSTWQCNLEYAQDWETTNSLSRYLHDHEGETVAATFEPKNGGASFTATLVIVPGTIGGAVDTVAVATVSLGVQGKPAYVAA